MGHFHAFNLRGVLHSLGEAEGSVRNRSPVGLKQIKVCVMTQITRVDKNVA